ncbi:uncharacterized protein BCR38DRAFT_490905 [Pseudomassariella vexata]|uniref:Carrier domain-containing protein n=1 Tax=Pseudomassariella vexata TaxID=1141098 RepID=A0A1Y2D9H8_9PEZI|nr:uncharacterized protein BCR38DRAFT_490905 [Pseudomassariella vexata]ORY55898.1 hypothetical protein BCR38DRAFT_490905 [Pseudomassariella vexata]
MSTGKLDRKAVSTLPIPEADANVNDDVVWTSTEERLKAVWEQVLESPACITPATDFFHAGGTSLPLLSLRDKIRTQFGVELRLLDLFEASVLSSMARRIEGQIDTLDVIDWDEETRLPPSLVEMDSNMLQRISHS